MNEAVDSTIIQISSSCVRWWSSFVCSLRFDLFHEVFWRLWRLLRKCMNEAVDSTINQISSSFFGIWSKEGYHETPHSRFIPFGFVFQEFCLESFILDEFWMPPAPPRSPRAAGAIGNFKSRLPYDPISYRILLHRAWSKFGLNVVLIWSKPDLNLV